MLKAISKLQALFCCNFAYHVAALLAILNAAFMYIFFFFPSRLECRICNDPAYVIPTRTAYFLVLLNSLF